MSLISRFCELYKELANLQLDQLDSIYHSEVVFEDPVARHTGIEQVKGYFANLLANTTTCTFTIHNVADCKDNNAEIDHLITWTMTLKTGALNKGRAINMQGTTLLKVHDNKIIYHRDYYDVGQMVYENIPILGSIIKKIKHRMAKQ
ncbi:nuclear transport factor 2 family protein [Alteromonas sediminis]|uniref:Nuclear transport factor 2 family protein n=1 Tax=Alteromonas sediminis TaxID=2259342 RepID=A0A3N5XYE3_9ALTE|nr:nuclear transport factor 2 family protein [Alteromonas sediminis]RPJ65570.1 nuclear transport factor 2 family protein [Alteromonas sediminis]